METDNIIKIQRGWRAYREQAKIFAQWTRLYRSMFASILTHVDNSYQENKLDKYDYNASVDMLWSCQDLIYSEWETIHDFWKINRCLKCVIEHVGHCDLCDAIYFYTSNMSQLRSYVEQLEYLVPFWKCVKVELQDMNAQTHIEFDNHIFTDRNLTLQLNGGKLFVPLEQDNKVICAYGYFEVDHINKYHTHVAFSKKYSDLVSLIANISASNEFKTNFLRALPFKEFIMRTNESIASLCTDEFQKAVLFKKWTIAQKVKSFISCDQKEQYHIISRLLMDTADGKGCMISTLLLDLITNHEENSVIPCVGTILLGCLHNCLRIKYQLKKKMVKIEESEADAEVPYKTRIEMLCAGDNVKAKAIAKLKEIESSRGDGNGKAEQYLDGLLSVPFGTYMEEGIQSTLEHYIADMNGLNAKIFQSIGSNNEIMDMSALSALTKDNIETVAEFSKCGRGIKAWLHAQQTADYTLPATVSAKFSDMKMFDLRKLCNAIRVPSTGTKAVVVERLMEQTYSLEKLELAQSVSNEFNLGIPTLVLVLVHQVEAIWDTYLACQHEYFTGVERTLDKCVYGMDNAKKQIMRLLAQWVHGKNEGSVFGFEGPPGTGKTTIAKHGISQCLKDENGEARPFIFIPLGGTSNGSTLEGHHYTYLGSTWGRIMDGIMNAKCMNPIIYIDELDKVSQTERGKEIIGILTHLTDPSQNTEFTDRYFSGIHFDLSKCLFIFSYNDASLVDPILLDRIQKIVIEPLSTDDKYNVCTDYIMPEIMDQLGYEKGDIWMERDVMEYIIDAYTCEAGARKIKEKLYELCREANMVHMRSGEIEIPFQMTKEYVDEVFKDYHKRDIDLIHDEPKVGMVNGLFATAAGFGGITLIEACKFATQTHMELKLTGLQGDVMKESMNVAKTLALNLVPMEVLSQIQKVDDVDKFGIHMHCPAGGVPKDGPSAGTAITVAIVSLLCGIPVRNDHGLTGEINLQGQVMPIGGLKSKVSGAKQANIRHVLCPKKNVDDYKKIAPNYEDDDAFELTMIESIYDALEHLLVMPEGTTVREYFRAV